MDEPELLFAAQDTGVDSTGPSNVAGILLERRCRPGPGTELWRQASTVSYPAENSPQQTSLHEAAAARTINMD